MARDKHSHALLEQSGWRVLTIWECELKGSNLEPSLEKLVNAILSEV